jgi:tetratricopeptide (TPR) repeat protein
MFDRRKPNKLNFFRFLFLFFVSLWISACVVVPAPIESHYNRGVDLYDQGEYSKAIAQYKLALISHPEDHFASYNLAVAYQDQGKTNKAEELYKKVLSVREDTGSRINLAAIYLSQGKTEESLSQLRIAGESDKDNPNPASVLGEYLERLGKLSESEKSFKNALDIDEKHAPTHYRLGRLFIKKNAFDKAQIHLKRAAELNPKEATYLEELAKEEKRRGNSMEAIALYERVSLLQPDRPEIWFQLGDLYKQNAYFKQAAMRFWTALELDQNNPAIHRALLEIYQKLTKREKDSIQAVESKNTIARKP